MKRKIVAAVVLALGVTAVGGVISPAISQTVSLGAVETRSALNQPLSVRVPVNGLRDDLEVVLAPSSAYARQGLDRSMLPSDLSVVVEGGEVRVTTERPVREPYLPLLLEARWSGGRVIREYAILLDPPTVISQARSPVARIEAPRESVVSGTPPVSSRAAPPRAAAESLGDSHVVQRGETLFSIVQRWGFSGDDIARAAIAVVEANPSAFIVGDPNRLRAEATLQRPNPAQVANVSLAQAREALSGQGSRAAVPPPAAPAQPEGVPEVAVDEVVPETEGVAAIEGDDAGGEEAVAEDAQPPVEMAELVAEPEASTPDGSEVGEAQSDRLEIAAIDGLEGSAALIEQVAAREIELEEMQSQLAQAARARGETQRLLEMANSDLARLESSLNALNAEREELRAQLEELRAASDRPAIERLMSDPLLMALAGSSVILLLLLLWSVLRRRGGADDWAADRADNSGVKAAPQPHAGIEVEAADDEPLLAAASRAGGTGQAGVAVAGGVASGAGGIAAVTADPQDAIEKPAGIAGGSAPDAAGANAGASSRIVADVLAEVEVYLAYGMEDQALGSLDRALKDAPGEPELLLRRVDALIALGREDEARTALAEVRAKLPKDDARISEREQSLGGGLNTGGLSSTSGAASDLDFSVDAPADDSVTHDTSGLDRDMGLDFDDSLPSAAHSAGGAGDRKSSTPDRGDDLGGLSFDPDDSQALGDGRSGVDVEVRGEPTFAALDALPSDDDFVGSEPSRSSDEGLTAFDFGSGTENQPAGATQGANDFESFEIDDALSSVSELDADFFDSEKGTTQTNADFDAEAFQLDDSSSDPLMDLSENASLSLDGETAGLAADDLDVSGFDGDVDLRTRLDLARAYLEMEDRDGATELLDEILQQSGVPGVDEALIAEARELRQSLRGNGPSSAS